MPGNEAGDKGVLAITQALANGHCADLQYLAISGEFNLICLPIVS